jgi:hypothetical protein
MAHIFIFICQSHTSLSLPVQTNDHLLDCTTGSTLGKLRYKASLCNATALHGRTKGGRPQLFTTQYLQVLPLTSPLSLSILRSEAPLHTHRHAHMPDRPHARTCTCTHAHTRTHTHIIHKHVPPHTTSGSMAPTQAEGLCPGFSLPQGGLLIRLQPRNARF